MTVRTRWRGINKKTSRYLLAIILRRDGWTCPAETEYRVGLLAGVMVCGYFNRKTLLRKTKKKTFKHFKSSLYIIWQTDTFSSPCPAHRTGSK